MHLVDEAPLADDFFRMVHDHVSGRPLLHPRRVSVGLAAALLGEVAVERRVAWYKGQVVVTGREPPADALCHAVLDQLRAEPRPHPLREWLAFLADDAVDRVGERLHRAGHVYPHTTRRLIGRSTVRWAPVDMNVAGWPAARLATSLRQCRPLDGADIFLAGLAVATGRDRSLLDGADPLVWAGLRDQLAEMWPPLAELARATRVVLDRAVVAHRA